jgi:hypothetical protein
LVIIISMSLLTLMWCGPLGTRGRELFLLLEGKAGVFMMKEGVEISLAEIGPGAYFGEMVGRTRKPACNSYGVGG